MRNPHDENELRALIHEMNIGFSAPQNGGVDSGSGVIILQNGEDPEAVDSEKSEPEEGGMNAQEAIGVVINNLNHLLRDLEQGCQGDAQIEELQKCCGTLGVAIEAIGNDPMDDDNQEAAYSGLNNEDPNQSDVPGGDGAETGMSLAT